MTERDGELKIIRGAHLAPRAWEPPAVGEARPGDGAPTRRVGGAPTASQLEALQEQARLEGYEQGRQEGQSLGRREGLEEGRHELRNKLGQLDGLVEALDVPFAELDEQVEREIVALVIGMVRQLVRREVKTDPGQIVGVVREALGVLPVAARNVRVLLHPEDAVLVREAYALGDAGLKWRLVEDPVIQRGGCKVVTDTSRVDATLESRIGALIAPLLAGQREDDEA
jgi:flagellar assembly protein FliH